MSTPALPGVAQTFGMRTAISPEQATADCSEVTAKPSVGWSAALHLVWREPLVHFVLLGALIFAGDAVLHAQAKDD